MFDFPTSAVDYLHRAGRTARAGRKGIVTSFVTRRDATLARVMERATRARTDALSSELSKRREQHLRVKKEESAARRNKIEARGAPTPGRKNPDPIDSRDVAVKRAPSAKTSDVAARGGVKSTSNFVVRRGNAGGRAKPGVSSARGRSSASRRGARR